MSWTHYPISAGPSGQHQVETGGEVSCLYGASIKPVGKDWKTTFIPSVHQQIKWKGEKGETVFYSKWVEFFHFMRKIFEKCNSYTGYKWK